MIQSTHGEEEEEEEENGEEEEMNSIVCRMNIRAQSRIIKNRSTHIHKSEAT